MALTIKTIVAAAIPTFAALLSFLWFRRKKKDPVPAIEAAPSSPVSSVKVEQELEEGDEQTETVVQQVDSKVCTADHPNSSEQCSGDHCDAAQADADLCDSGTTVSANNSEVSEHIVTAKSLTVSQEKTCSEVKMPCPSPQIDDKKALIETLGMNNNVNCNTDRSDNVITHTNIVEVTVLPEAESKVKSSKPSSEEKPIKSPKDSKVTNHVMPGKTQPPAPVKAPSSMTPSNQTSSKNKSSGSIKKESKTASPVKKEEPKPSSPQRKEESKSSPPAGRKEELKSSPLAKKEKKDNSIIHRSIKVLEEEVSSVTGEKLENSLCSRSPLVESPVDSGSVGSSNGSGSEATSEASADSGRGASLHDIPSPTSKADDPAEIIVYEFDFPTRFCGKFIGRFGRNIGIIKERSGADISVKRKPYSQNYQIVHLKGTRKQVNIALDMIKQRFPPRKFRINYNAVEQQVEPDADLQPELPKPILPAEMMQLSLPEGCTVDVIVSSVVSPNHLFLQQPTHPTFPMLERLNQVMLICYSQNALVPQLPRPVEAGTVCAAPMAGGWYRAMVLQSYAETDECDIKYVDYGGYMRVQGCLLKQIRSDFTTLPFQAVECYMANVIPKDDEFPPESCAMMEQMVHGKLLQAEIVGYEEDGVPYLQLFEMSETGTLLVNRELVNQGVARWLENEL